MQEIQFTVDSELLRELGERLVGRQYIALAELVKNSFDADASRVEIRIQDDCIQVSDNGHGMTEEDFVRRWMRVGSTHKVRERTSPELNRPLTGSKGVGRLAVQFLASELDLTSVPNKTLVPAGLVPRELWATVNWDTAIRAGELTEATAQYDFSEPRPNVFPLGKPHGTTVTLRNLKHEWNPKEFEDLAREIWFLQPPFRSLSRTGSGQPDGFEVNLFAPDPAIVSVFNTQMSRILDLYSSRLVGKLLPGDDSSEQLLKRRVLLSLELEGQPTPPYEFQVPVRGDDRCLIDSLDFEIRIFTLQRRQPYGIPVRRARDYMGQWGGVHIYDAGFRIPYAGPSADWLNLEFDHSHRLTQSQLLPSELNVQMGLNHLPTNSRVLGVVNIDTTHEARAVGPNRIPSNQHLQIQVSRDRLVGNGAFRQLQDAVRFSLDYYATRLAAHRHREKAAKKGTGTPKSLVENVWDVLEQHESEIPKQVATKLKTELEKTVDAVREQSEWTRSQSGLLGAMATVGATALAFDHQFNQQLSILEQHVATLESAIQKDPHVEEWIGPVSASIKRWIQDARDTRRIFSPISDERNRTAVKRFRARSLVESLVDNLRTILRGVRVDVSAIDKDLLLPEASYPVWMAIFYNVLMNASNAMLDSNNKQMSLSSFRSGNRRGIQIQDTGVGIDLAKAESLFQPLKRGLEISPERRALGYGGTGLGLAIVRMLATDLKADVHFKRPMAPFKTCFEIAWSEDS